MGNEAGNEEEITGNDEFSAVGEDLSAAWDSKHEEETDDAEETIEGAGKEPETNSGDDKQEGREIPDTEGGELSGEGGDNGEDNGTKTNIDVAADTSTPPVGLSPEAREAWKDTPPAMQKAIAKREAEFTSKIRTNSEAAKRAESMDKALAPYQQYLQMNGGAQHIGNLLQTGANLQMGSPIQKAQMIADLIKTYAIDINTLDSMIVGGQPPAATQQTTDIQQGINQALAPFAGLMNDMQTREQQRKTDEQGQVASTVTTFASDPKNEFYNDVSADMADLMDMAANRGQSMSMEDAYKKACLMNTGISNVIASRTSVSDIAAKIAASASISGNPGGPGGVNKEATLADTLRRSWDNTGRV